MHPTAVEVTHKAMENIGPGVGERPGLTSGGISGFDAPGEQTRFGTRDAGRGEAGKPGAAFDGPWDRPEKTPAASPERARGHDGLQASRPLHEPPQTENLREAEAPARLDEAVKNYNAELAQTHAGGEYKEVRAENLEKRTPEETAAARREFNGAKGDLIGQWEDTNQRQWPTYDQDVTTAEGKTIRKSGDKFDAHHVQPLELGGKNTVDNITPMHASDHHDKQGIHRPGGGYDTMTQLVKGT